MQPYPWGPRQVLIGVLAFVGLFLLLNVGVLLVALQFNIRGDEGSDQSTLRLVLAATLLSQGLTFGIVGAVSKLEFKPLMQTLKLATFDWGSVLRPVGAVIVVYVLMALYVGVAQRFFPDFLVPSSTVPDSITKDPVTLALAAVVTVLSAPFVEELFFRGLVFGGLLKWGFWPAAAVSGMMFSLVHFDPGSIIPFFGIGVVLAWLFWSRGSLWDSVLFHFMFNSMSFMLLALTKS